MTGWTESYLSKALGANDNRRAAEPIALTVNVNVTIKKQALS